jgi:HEAT repeat protein
VGFRNHESHDDIRTSGFGEAMNGKFCIMILAGGLLSGCYSPDPISLNSDSAPREIPAIKQAANDHDRSAIPRLIQDLDDNDSAVRFAANTALKKITGQDFGYRYYDDESHRRPAIQRWQAWLKEHPSR